MLQTVALPEGRAGSAFALTRAAIEAVTADDPVLFALPPGVEADASALERAAAVAGRGAIAVFAVPAAGPEADRAYLRVSHGYVEEFVAAPDAQRALACFQAGYLWCTGAFAVRASVWIDAVGWLRPDLLRACERAQPAAGPAESIERAVMERISEAGLEAAVVPLDTAWREAA